MKLPAVLVRSWGDLQTNFDALAKAINVDKDGHGLRVATVNLRWGLDTTPPTAPATADTQAAAIPHGMTDVRGVAKTPAVVVGTVAGGAFAAALSPKATNLGSTTFDLRVSPNITITFTVGVYWLAIG